MAAIDIWTKLKIDKNFNSLEKKFIAAIPVTQKTLYTEDDKKGDLMIPGFDKTHVMWRRYNTTVPTVLWVHVNLMLNFVCNDFMGFDRDEVDCCTE